MDTREGRGGSRKEGEGKRGEDATMNKIDELNLELDALIETNWYLWVHVPQESALGGLGKGKGISQTYRRKTFTQITMNQKE